jgi:uracil-DNA glycosylase
MAKNEELEKLKEECLSFCQQHSLAEEGSQMVFGEGNSEAKVMLIGEAPGYNESISGRPFCGAAGGVLDELLQKVGLKREELYITNLLKLRPPDNRNPQEEEIQEFTPFLNKQIEIIQPLIICPLGNFASRWILQKYGLDSQLLKEGKRIGISKFHGQVFSAQSLFQELKIMPLYHPAVATYNPLMKEILEKDFRKLKELLI